MFYYRYNVDEAHLNKFCRHLHAAFLAGETLRIDSKQSARLQTHKIYDAESEAWIYFSIDSLLATTFPPLPKKSIPSNCVRGFVALSKIRDWVAMEVEILYVTPEFRGNGCALNLYENVLKDGVILVSGNKQNIKSRHLWLKMLENPKLTVWAHDLVNTDRYSPIIVDDDGDIYCQMKMYEDIKKRRRVKKQDIRYVAINPRYVR